MTERKKTAAQPEHVYVIACIGWFHRPGHGVVNPDCFIERWPLSKTTGVHHIVVIPEGIDVPIRLRTGRRMFLKRVDESSDPVRFYSDSSFTTVEQATLFVRHAIRECVEQGIKVWLPKLEEERSKAYRGELYGDRLKSWRFWSGKDAWVKSLGDLDAYQPRVVDGIEEARKRTRLS